MNNFPDHMSIHPGGMLISEEPIHAYTATYLPPKNFVTTHIDMFVAESVGLYKLDILSQRGLSHIKETIRLVKENKNIQIDIHEVEKFKNDFRVQAQVKNVNTIGCFYVESPAMRQLLKKLECDSYITLVAASSIIRPGVASSGMMREYIFRYHNEDKFTHIHPMMKKLMQETYGVMVYQEDVIKVAHHFAGLDMGDADILQRAMSGKYRGNEEMKRIREKFFFNCKAKSYPDEIAKEVWRQIESFGGYSFSKAHSASFAVESFQDLFLKTYYPMEFMVGVINNFGGFYDTSLYFYELMKTGATIQLPCVNNSNYLTNIHDREVFVGLVHIKELEKKQAEKIIEERTGSGIFLHLQDFIERTNITAEQLNILVSIGAFSFTGKSKKQLLWEANFLQKKNKTHAHASMFNEPPKEFALPVLIDNHIDDMYDEMEILGFPLRNPFEVVNDDPAKYIPAKEIGNHLHKQITVLGYYVTYKIVPKKITTRCLLEILLMKHWIGSIQFIFLNH
jgi:DNA polymerase III alpha subunit